VRPVHSPVQLLVLQHPAEVLEAKGTARLLHLCLPGSRLEVGERFDPAQLAAWLHAPWRAGDAPRHGVLLYPPTPDGDSLGLAASAPWPCPAPAPDALRLIVLDGTWRKSRKMLYANPALQTLPRLALAHAPSSRYGELRKAQAAHQRSTLEATACALAQLHPAGPAPHALWQAFEGLLAQQATLRPPSARNTA